MEFRLFAIGRFIFKTSRNAIPGVESADKVYRDLYYILIFVVNIAMRKTRSDLDAGVFTAVTPAKSRCAGNGAPELHP